jgi:hypothetical protein
MYQGGYGQNLSDLIALQMADHVPTDFFRQTRTVSVLFQEFGYLSMDPLQLLNTVLTKVGKTEMNDFLYGLDSG